MDENKTWVEEKNQIFPQILIIIKVGDTTYKKLIKKMESKIEITPHWIDTTEGVGHIFFKAWTNYMTSKVECKANIIPRDQPMGYKFRHVLEDTQRTMVSRVLPK